MTPDEFNSLGEDEKALATWDGTFVGSRSNGIVTIQLYALPEFYIKVYYHTVNNQIIGFRPLSGVSHLDPYLDDIDISALRLNL